MLTKHVEHVLTQKTRCVKKKRPVNSFWRGKDPGKDENTLGQSYLDIIRPWSTLKKSLVSSSIPRLSSKLLLIRPSQTSVVSDQTVPGRLDLRSDECVLEDHCAVEVRSKPPLIRRVPDCFGPFLLFFNLLFYRPNPITSSIWLAI